MGGHKKAGLTNVTPAHLLLIFSLVYVLYNINIRIIVLSRTFYR